ncbi:MAG: lipopolysaccharide biosynthesis protein [Pirellulaceae bacterium]
MTATGDPQPFPHYRSVADLENAIRSGTRWALVGQVVSQFISFLVLAVVYRWVAPDQFGLLGMVMPLLLLAKIFSSLGLQVATVQRGHLTPRQLTSVFWISLLVSTGVAVGTAAGGPVLAWAYQTPALSGLVPALAGTLIVAAAGAQHQALLERKLLIGRLAGARVLAQVMAGITAAGAAVAGAGVWALVAQQYVELLVLGILVWGMEPWRPQRPTRGEKVGNMLQFGSYYALSSLMFFVAQNIDKVLIAGLLGATRQGQAALGMYTQAFNLMMKPVYVVSTPLTGIMLPALSRVVARSPEDFAGLVVRFYRMVGIVLLPAGVGLTVVARDVMLVLGGESWLPAGTILLCLAPTILVQGFVNVAGSVFAAAGHANRLFRSSLAVAILLTAGCVVGYQLGTHLGEVPWGPTIGVAVSYTLTGVLIVCVPYLWICFRTVGIAGQEVVRPLLRPALAALSMGVAVASVQGLLTGAGASPLPRLLTCIGLGVAIFALLARRDLRWLVAQLRDAGRPNVRCAVEGTPEA